MATVRKPRRKSRRVENRNAVAVVRVSSGEQVLGQSLEQQEDRIRTWSRERGLELVRVYRQEGESAGSVMFDRRSGGGEILQMIDREEISHIIVTRLDRAFRNVLDCLQWVAAWEQLGVVLHFTDEPHLTEGSSRAVSRLFLTQRAGQAQFERDITSERTKAALAFRKAKGEVYTRIPPFGFENGPDGKLQQIPAEQRTIERIKRMRSQKLSFREIADRLNRDDVPTKTGAEWAAMVVSRILARNSHEKKASNV
ncbi:MAG: recombinase family protein [Bryobacterales bacterium]|nr:recombinase family protein [Bryobacterales bacterium]